MSYKDIILLILFFICFIPNIVLNQAKRCLARQQFTHLHKIKIKHEQYFIESVLFVMLLICLFHLCLSPRPFSPPCPICLFWTGGTMRSPTLKSRTRGTIMTCMVGRNSPRWPSWCSTTPNNTIPCGRETETSSS